MIPDMNIIRRRALDGHRFLATTPRTYEQRDQRFICRQDIQAAVFLVGVHHPRAATARALAMAAWHRTYYGGIAGRDARPELQDAAVWNRIAKLNHPLP